MPDDQNADASQQPRDQSASLTEHVAKKEDRKITARKEASHGIWFGLGMFGIVGWSVAIPTLIGVATGVWIDRARGGGISGTLSCLVLGLALGCLLAWYWIKQETDSQ